ncbi:MAG: hypothetical protein KDE33_21885 [Bacteroidetes bacterium]|nr:hypothetical protein [Bacteroidota bacterium]
MNKYYAHGKLMLTGEYVVLDGANTLAVPTKFGQKLEVQTLENNRHQIEWKSYNNNDELWLNTHFPKDDKNEFEERLFIILKEIEKLNAEVFYNKNFSFKTYLEFPNNWGLGSSSTLISLLSQWSGVDAYQLLEKTFGGSGYDIACATANTPIVYNVNDKTQSKSVVLNSNWTKNTFFVFLEQKQNSREAIAYYKTLKQTEKPIDDFNSLTESLINCTNTIDAIQIVAEHESVMSNLLKIESVNSRLFSDFAGKCKSLGAWGGDFIMAISNEGTQYVENYFKNKGYKTIFNFDKMIWKE